MTSNSYGKAILAKYGYKGGPLGIRKTGVTRPLVPISSYFNGQKVTTYKAIFNERDSKRWALIAELTDSLEQKENNGKTFFLPGGLTLAKLHLSK